MICSSSAWKCLGRNYSTITSSPSEVGLLKSSMAVGVASYQAATSGVRETYSLHCGGAQESSGEVGVITVWIWLRDGLSGVDGCCCSRKCKGLCG